ncbi:MAG: MerR family DNA-binding transcriptional regulator [Myxococcota bacterium]
MSRHEAESFVASHLAPSEDEEVFGIADLASEFEVTPRTIRFYESKGLLSPRRVAGSRIYGRRDRARLILILRAKALGSSLEEIRHFLDLYGRSGEGRVRQLEFVVRRTGEEIEELEGKRRQLDQTLAELRHIHQTCRGRLRKAKKP